MKVPASWLHDYIDGEKLSTKAMADALEAGGIEVEHIQYSNKLDEQIIVAEVKKVMQHPNADKLHLAIIDTGQAEIEVVCGAPHLEVGMIVTFAQVGAKLPDGTVMKEAVIRGKTSPGMLTTAAELGISDDSDGLYLLPTDTKLGSPVNELLAAGDIIEVTTQANRFDLLSILSLAREVSAQTDSKLTMPPASQPESKGDQLEVEIVATEAVKRMMMVALEVKRSTKTPDSMAKRLEQSGSRTINPVVDVTNFTMLETGQPTHAFDAAKLVPPLTVRYADPSETLETLDGVKRQLTAKDLVIADTKGPLDLAGVMGGKRAEVTLDTTELILVSGCFDGATVRKMAQRHTIRTEASARFERNLPVEAADFGLQRTLKCLQEVADAKQTSAVFDYVGQKPVTTRIVVTPDQLAKVLSIKISAEAIVKQLSKLGFIIRPDGTSLEVEVPWWRPDVKLAEDLAEEYIRLVGFDDVPARLPVWHPTEVKADTRWPRLWQTKSTLKGLGLFEVITYSFVSKDQLERFGYKPSQHLKLKNPMSIEQAYLRQNLLPSLLEALIRNQGYRPEFGLYEVSHVFVPTKPGTQPKEPEQLGILVKNQQGYKEIKKSLDALMGAFGAALDLEKSDFSEFLPGYSAVIKSGNSIIGRIGVVHPKCLTGLRGRTQVGYLELDLEQLLAASTPRKYQAISRFPSIYRDLSIVVKTEVLWQDVAAAITTTELAKVSFLSDYYGDELAEGHKSLSMRLEMFSLEATLTDKEADKRLEKIIGLLHHRFNASERA